MSESPATLFSKFSFESSLIEEILQLEEIDIQNKTTILREGEYVKVIPLLIQGLIKLRKIDDSGREIIFYHIEPGESCILSVLSCLNNKESQAEAIAEKNSRIIAVNSEKLAEWMEKY